MSLTITVSEIFDFFENFIKILKIPYLRHFGGFSDSKKLKMFVLNCSFTLC